MYKKRLNYLPQKIPIFVPIPPQTTLMEISINEFKGYRRQVIFIDARINELFKKDDTIVIKELGKSYTSSKVDREMLVTDILAFMDDEPQKDSGAARPVVSVVIDGQQYNSAGIADDSAGSAPTDGPDEPGSTATFFQRVMAFFKK